MPTGPEAKPYYAVSLLETLAIDCLHKLSSDWGRGCATSKASCNDSHCTLCESHYLSVPGAQHVQKYARVMPSPCSLTQTWTTDGWGRQPFPFLLSVWVWNFWTEPSISYLYSTFRFETQHCCTCHHVVSCYTNSWESNPHSCQGNASKLDEAYAHSCTTIWAAALCNEPNSTFHCLP